MEEFMTKAVELIASADVWIAAISGLVLALAGIAKLTKTKKDDAVIAKILAGLDKIKNLTLKFKKNK